MIQSIESLRERRGETEDRPAPRRDADVASPRIRSRIAGGMEPEPVERLIRKLAADHLRELRDDGLTIEYVARMYGISAERMEILYGELLPSPPR